ncbi:MAG: Uma2 family endonuclease [Saprospiraceae bacterium]|nr:Uma2 family endonuclease [Saprospiraceae bacterium]
MGNIHASESPLFLPQKLRLRTYELKSIPRYTHEDFVEFCAENSGLRLEQDKNGNILVMPPVEHDGGFTEFNVIGYLFVWWNSHQKGLAYSPSTGFLLPDGSTRSADGAWASDEKVAALTPQQRKKFAPLVPDFVIEIRSESDRINKLKKKMTDTWMANGVRLGWLLDTKMKKSYVYRAGQPVEELDGFDRSLSGEEVCLGFELDLRKLG